MLVTVAAPLSRIVAAYRRRSKARPLSTQTGGLRRRRRASAVRRGADAAVVKFGFLSGRFQFAARPLLSALARVAVDQALFTPVFLAYYFAVQAFALGRIARLLVPAWERSAGVRGAAALVSFMFVPLHLRPFWTYLSYVDSRVQRKGADGQDAGAASEVLVKAE
ncbi:hypothetical protein F4810DRAFT_708271 [Camillea tinctor]|nr:hypothetical protein F4810DRAFT_708271 [Camillea tinctor]